MISKIYKSLLNIGLISFFLFTIVLGIPISDSWAEAPLIPIASLEKVQSITKDLEGKTQEAIGNITGDPKNQIIGKAKQAEADVRNAAEAIKTNVPERVKSGAKDLEGKAQEAIGNVVGDRQNQIAGKSKQVESKTRNFLEDAKDKVKEFLE